MCASHPWKSKEKAMACAWPICFNALMCSARPQRNPVYVSRSLPPPRQAYLQHPTHMTFRIHTNKVSRNRRWQMYMHENRRGPSMYCAAGVGGGWWSVVPWHALSSRHSSPRRPFHIHLHSPVGQPAGPKALRPACARATRIPGTPADEIAFIDAGPAPY